MALPQMTEEQRKAALEKAIAMRKQRAEFRADIKAGRIDAAGALARRLDPIVGRIKVSQFIQSFPGWGKAKAKSLMAEIGISDTRRLAGLGEQQVAKLAERLV